MKSDECILEGKEPDIAHALLEVEKVAQYNGLSKKETLQLRLLAEELLGMQKGILGFIKGTFYMENKGKTYNLCLHSDIRVEEWTREKFVQLSTGNHNMAYHGFMGKVREIADNMMNDPVKGMCFSNYDMGNSMILTSPAIAYEQIWTLTQYREQEKQNMEAWDELEKSIVANIADEVIVGARTNYVDIIVVKKF
ncbi:MAG: hypothetical protein SOV61_00550 [Lachnospiraceae bacterium]|nr:hypothetical protein [Lachnospiraceae bacterium]